MKKVVTAIVITAAVAGIVIYIKNNKQARKALGKFENSAKKQIKKVDWTKVGTEAVKAAAAEAAQPAGATA